MRCQRYNFPVEGSTRGEIVMKGGGGVLDFHKSGNEFNLDLHINESPKWNSSLLDFCIIYSTLN